jgi:hypothetical protein
MPAGERSQVWYPELVALLRREWRSDLPWEAIVELRDHLQSQIEGLRARRGIVPPVIRCSACGATGPAAPPTISIRAILLAVGRFGIEPSEAVRQRERNWARYRAQHDLNLLGRPIVGNSSEAPSAHEHEVEDRPLSVELTDESEEAG